MSSDTSRQVRLIVTVIVAIAALLMIVVVPLVTAGMVDPIVQGQLERVAKFKAQGTPEGNTQAALLGPAMWLVSFFFPFWATLTFAAGVALLVVLKKFYAGAPWTRGFVLLMLAMPSICGAYTLVPWFNFVAKGFPPALITMAIGLIPYFVVLLATKGDLLQKAIDFAVFLMMGVAAAENFANGHAAFRVLYGHPKRPGVPNEIAALAPSFIALWITVVLFIIAIYLVGNRKWSGWYYAMTAGWITVLASGVTHYFRSATNDYLYGALFGLSVVILLAIPAVNKRLFESTD
jgi:hypothetical protein